MDYLQLLLNHNDKTFFSYYISDAELFAIFIHIALELISKGATYICR